MSLIENIERNNLSLSIIDDIENECYLKPQYDNFLKREIETRLVDFSSWFNSTARLYFLKCEPCDSELIQYLLRNLENTLKLALTGLNKSVNAKPHKYMCTCGEEIVVAPWQNVWRIIQNHPHIEENLNLSLLSSTVSMHNGASSNSEVSDDLSSTTTSSPASAYNTHLNDFKFNFAITYDSRVEEYLYPKRLVSAARTIDNIADYTIRLNGLNQGVCLLCACSLMSMAPKKRIKINPFIIRSHATGQKHLKFASEPKHIISLKQYHEFWKSQEATIQAHQVFFLTSHRNSSCHCQLCQDIVPYNCLNEHLINEAHKSKFISIFNTERNSQEFFLLNLQVRLYGVVINDKETKKKENTKPLKNCVITEFRIDPSGATINLPPRYQSHLQFLRKEANRIFCSICNKSFANEFITLKRHVCDQVHKELSGITDEKYRYFCEICNLSLKDEDGWDNHFTKGPHRHLTIPLDRQQKTMEHECKTCMLVIYGDDKSIQRHTTTRCGLYDRAKEIRLPFPVKKLFQSGEFIMFQAHNLQLEAKYVLQTKSTIYCCKELEHALSGVFPHCKAYPFGSRVSGLGNNNSDIDIFMDIGGMYEGLRYQDPQAQESFVIKATKIFKSHKDVFSYVFPIPAARTPIIKLRHKFTSLDCDISFRHGLGVENTKFLLFCIDLQPITQPFILMLKRWSDCCNMNEYMTNYGLALMAIFFLQVNGHLLSVKAIRIHNNMPSLVIDGWETLRYTVSIQVMRGFVKAYTGDIKQLLRDFFYYYSKFDYANQVVCPLLGCTVPKFNFNEDPKTNLPIEMKSYVNRIGTENGEQFRGLSPFCIQDPFDLSHNLTKAMQHSITNNLKTFCTLTYEFLDTIK